RGDGRLGVGDGGLSPAVAPQVEIGDDLCSQVVDVLDDRDVGFAFAGDAEFVEHAAAETVRGGDGAGVEVGQRLSQPGPPRVDVLAREMTDEHVVARPCTVGIGEGGGDLREPVPGAFTQFL